MAIHSKLFNLMLCSVKQAQQILKLHGIELTNYALTKTFRNVHLGRAIRIKYKDLAEYIDLHKNGHKANTFSDQMDDVNHYEDKYLEYLTELVYYVPIPIVTALDKFLFHQELEGNLGADYFWQGKAKSLLKHLQILSNVDNLMQLLPDTAFGLSAMITSNLNILGLHGISVSIGINPDQSKVFAINHKPYTVHGALSVNEISVITQMSDTFIHNNMKLSEDNTLTISQLAELINGEQSVSEQDIPVITEEEEANTLADDNLVTKDTEAIMQETNKEDNKVVHKTQDGRIITTYIEQKEVFISPEPLETQVSNASNLSDDGVCEVWVTEPIKNQVLDKVITVEQASTEFGISVSDLYKLAFENADMVVRQQDRLYLDRATLKSYLPVYITQERFTSLIWQFSNTYNRNHITSFVKNLLEILQVPVMVVHEPVPVDDNTGTVKPYDVQKTINKVNISHLVEKLESLIALLHSEDNN